MSSKLAALFPGQGAQKVGMGAEVWSSCERSRQMLDIADAALGYSLSELMAQGPQEELTRTEHAQPALLLLTAAIGVSLEERGVRPQAMAGHSLGQYAALVVSGALALEDALPLVRERGRLMQQTVPDGGAMMLIVGLDRAQVYEAVERFEGEGVVDVACHNAPEQTVISGDEGAVEQVADACEDLGAGVLALQVSAPFHSRLLLPMVAGFEALVGEVPMEAPRVPVIDNVSALPLAHPDQIRESLVSQITRPVLFEESLLYLRETGVDTFVHCGPGKSTAKQARATVPDAQAVLHSDLEGGAS